MGRTGSSPGRPQVRWRTHGSLPALWVYGVLTLSGSIAAGDVGTLGEGISAYHRGDYSRAFEILDDLALDANPAALAKAGHMHQLGQGTPKNLHEALRYYREGAIRGSAEAQARLGRMYLNGTGVPRDEDQGLRLLRQAAQGDSALAYQLASIFLDGEGVPQDTQHGMSLLAAAADDGNVDARDRLMDIYFDDANPTARARALVQVDHHKSSRRCKNGDELINPVSRRSRRIRMSTLEVTAVKSLPLES